MCIILLALGTHRDYPLIVAANRDEAYARPAAPAAFWSDHPQIHGGRDLDKGGTWLGLSLTGRFAAVTNFRNGHSSGTAPRSRGELVSDYLSGEDDTEDYLERVKSRGEDYNGYILIAGYPDALYWLSNRGSGIERITPGVHGLSNHLLDTPWPKIRQSKRAMETLLGAAETGLAAGLFELLADRTPAPDHELPDTGVGLERERVLSPIFISGERYGTRASTVVLVDRNGGVFFAERSFGTGGQALGATVNRFRLGNLSPAATASGQAAG